MLTLFHAGIRQKYLSACELWSPNYLEVNVAQQLKREEKQHAIGHSVGFKHRDLQIFYFRAVLV